MRNSKLYSILEYFDKYEQNRLRKYLQSSYFNKNEILVDLFEIIISDINKHNGNEVTKESIWAILIPDSEYDDVRFRKYFSELLKLVEGYLAQQIYDANPALQSIYLLEAIGNKKLKKLYNGTMKTARRLSQDVHRTSEYYYFQYNIEKNFYNLIQFDTKRSHKSNVEEIAINLDYFYLSEKLRLWCEILSRKNVASYEYELLFIDEILHHIESKGYENIPPIAIYHQISLLYQDFDKEEHYFKLKMLLDKYALEFPKDQARDELYMAAQNYCIRKMNLGNFKFLNELFLLYQDLLDKKIIIAEGELSPWYFKNIVVTGLRLGKFAWIENFIAQYQIYLPNQFRENAVTYNLAQLYFYQKQYDKVIEKLRDVEFDDFSYNLNSKTILLATFYEKEEIEPLYSLLESFRTYLNRHKDIPENRRIHYKNLIRFTKKLTKITPGDKKAVKKLRDDVIKAKDIASINWLREKIAELEA